MYEVRERGRVFFEYFAILGREMIEGEKRGNGWG